MRFGDQALAHLISNGYGEKTKLSLQIMLQLEKRRDAPCPLLYHGSLGNVLKGHIPAGFETDWIEANRFAYGFMEGSPRGLSSAGELVVTQGLAFAKSTDIADYRFYQVVHGTRFVSQAVIGVSPDAEFSAIAGWRAPKNHSKKMSEVCNELYQHVQRPFFFAGLVTFEKLHATALSLPPISEEAIFEHRSRYWAFPPKREEGGTGIVLGIVANLADKKHANLHRKLTTALHPTSFAPNLPLTMHVHTATLLTELEAIVDLKPDQVDDVLSLLPDTTLSNFRLEIYFINDIEPLTDRSPHHE